MPIGTAIALAAGLGAAGSVAGGAISAAGAGKQATAAQQAASLQADATNRSTAEQQRQFDVTQKNEAPFIQAGQGAVTSLYDAIKDPGKGLLTPFTDKFTAPTAAEAEAYPGYQFQLQQGLKALQNSAAAKGGLLSGGTAKAVNNYAQGAAQSDYTNVYNQKLGEYQNAYNIFQNNQANSFNRLASVAGLGQTSVGQLGQTGQATAASIGNTLLTGATNQGQALQNAGNAMASGYNTIGSGIAGGANSVGSGLLLQDLLRRVPGYGSQATTPSYAGSPATFDPNDPLGSIGTLPY